jgi:chromosome segregation ATPase
MQERELASFEVEQESVKKLLEAELKDREDLERRLANLEQGKRTEEIKREIEELVKDIRDSQASLDKAQKDFDSLTVQISNMKTSIQARVINIRQNLNRLDSWREEMTAYYEKSRAAAQEVCNATHPGSSQTPLPKRKQTPN